MQLIIAYNATMDIETLELFIDVMHQRNFTEIARARNLAPSSVSRTITGLEKELGIKLFQRSTRRLEPTEAAVIYYQRIAPIVSELESAKQIAADITEEPRGTLRVTASVTYGQMHIVPHLPELEKQFNSLSIELILTDTCMDLIENRIDVAIRLGTLPDSSHIARKLSKMEFSICASPKYIEKYGSPQTPQEIENHDCLLFPRTGHDLNWLFKNSDGNITDISVSGKCLITNSQAIKQCAISGMGLALLPDWLIRDDIQSGSLVRLFNQFDVSATDYSSAVWILYPSRDYVPLKTRVFIDHLIRRFSEQN